MKEIKKKSYLKQFIWISIITGFAIMEFPGIFFINRIEPFIFGLPFIYGFTIIIWIYMCVITFIGYITNWGRGSSFVEITDDLDEMREDNKQ